MADTTDRSGIIRTHHDRDNPYTMVNKAAFEDKRLSWEARGVLGYLLVKPDGWQIRINDLLDQSTSCGRDQMRRILNELEAYGYLVRERKPVDRGRFDWVSHIYETPRDPSSEKIEQLAKRKNRKRKTTAQTSTDFQAMAPSTDLPSTVNQSIYLVPSKPNTESHERVGSQQPAPAPARKRAPPPTLDFAHEGVATWKRLTGKRKITPVIARLIAETITDIASWEQKVTAWLQAGFNPNNVSGMVDWYLHPEKMERRNGSAPNRSNPADARPPLPPAQSAIPADALTPAEVLARLTKAREASK